MPPYSRPRRGWRRTSRTAVPAPVRTHAGARPAPPPRPVGQRRGAAGSCGPSATRCGAAAGSVQHPPLAGRGSCARAPIDPARVPMPPPLQGPLRVPPGLRPRSRHPAHPSRAGRAPSTPPSRPASVRFRSRIRTHRDHAPGEPPVNDASPVRGGRRSARREYGRAATTPRAGGADRADGPRSTGLPALVQGGAGRGRTGRSGTPVDAASRTRSPASPPSARDRVALPGKRGPAAPSGALCRPRPSPRAPSGSRPQTDTAPPPPPVR